MQKYTKKSNPIKLKAYQIENKELKTSKIEN